MLRTLKTVAIAATVVLATAGASMAATWAYVDHTAKVLDDHDKNADPINWVKEGQKVQVVGQWKNWYKLKLKGPDGWVRANVIDFDYYDDDYYDDSTVAVVPGGGDATAYCAQRFKSYDPASGTYLGYDGQRHPCP